MKEELNVEKMNFHEKIAYTYKLQNELGKSKEEILKILKIENVELPKINLIKNFPKNLEESLNSRISFIESFKDIRDRFPHDILKISVSYLKLSLPAFQNESLINHWIKLNNLSNKGSEEFIGQITWHISHDYDWMLGLSNEHANELHHGKYIKKHCEELINLMENYQNLYFGHFITEKFINLQETLDRFIPDLESSIKEFETDRIESYKSSLWPITREYKSQDAKSLFFARRIYFFFKKIFNKPLHNINADFVNAIFETSYTENDIIKTVKSFKKYED